LDQKLLLLLMSLLLFKHFGIVLGNIGEGGGRHDDTEAKVKTFLFYLCIVDLGIITGFLDKFDRTSKAQS